MRPPTTSTSPASLGPRPLEVLVADGHASTRRAVGGMLAGEGGMRVVETATLDELVRALRAHLPDIVVLDPGVLGDERLEGLERLRRCAPGLPILLVGFGDDDAHAFEARRHGAVGYLAKTASPAEWVAAVRAAA
ncbi:MAG: two-component system, NarL family, invasion response regulator UvrY [Solirubrobacteraceae bacterium]|jgi:DNA-binding NarL/FixJ family response regulator|nr:two-component system, NarL family, invasion response regulator UvrY [Solirubrobacteraceae bacterium]MEA2276399.1 two-component system, NarL family, invasion response regulator UvrY [Solirubrobacteraceae bacterium]MEA2356850.1 two-component system, NarL family, invasion response regulator UvrY [Solirubrobacteraceae bacterium]MEA2392905.1 two-component system, NarL family, invasion response regulator UvrY [Solirubrobacteraceae bacterium]